MGVNTREKKAKALEAEFGGQTKKLELIEAKNKDLIAKLNSTEESKTKVVMRFANVLAGISNLTSKLMKKEQETAETNTKLEAASGAFLTQEPSTETNNAIPPSVMVKDLPGISNLTLTGNGIEDAEAVLIANALHDNQAVSEVTVRSNRIGDKGFVALGVSCLSNKSNITFLDVQYNHITLKGVETFATMLSEFADSTGHVLRANFEQENGMLIPVVQVHIRGPRKLTVDLRYNKLKPELPEGSSKAARLKSEKEADVLLLKIVRILARCGKHSMAHQKMLLKEKDHLSDTKLKCITAGESNNKAEEQRVVLHDTLGWDSSSATSKNLAVVTSSTKKLVKSRRHKKGQSRRSALTMSVSVKKRSNASKRTTSSANPRRKYGYLTHTKTSSAQFNIKDQERLVREIRQANSTQIPAVRRRGIDRLTKSPLKHRSFKR